MSELAPGASQASAGCAGTWVPTLPAMPLSSLHGETLLCPFDVTKCRRVRLQVAMPT